MFEGRTIYTYLICFGVNVPFWWRPPRFLGNSEVDGSAGRSRVPQAALRRNDGPRYKWEAYRTFFVCERRIYVYSTFLVIMPFGYHTLVIVWFWLAYLLRS